MLVVSSDNVLTSEGRFSAGSLVDSDFEGIELVVFEVEGVCAVGPLDGNTSAFLAVDLGLGGGVVVMTPVRSASSFGDILRL